jgi:hypothetical protein
MKNFSKKYILASILGSAMLFNSCTKDFEAINTGPNNPTDVPNSFYLTGAERGIMDNTSDVWFGANMGNQLAQYWSSNQYSSESRYLFRAQVTNDAFNEFYAGGRNDADINVGGLQELKKIVDNCIADPNSSSASGDPNNQIAIATMLRVWLLQTMTDTWGNIPYSQALQPEVTRTPVYDSQRDIYYGLLAEIDMALGKINENAIAPIVGDQIYNGDMASWKKFGNSVKMRLAIRIADVEPADAKTAFEAAAASGGLTSNGDNALLHYGESASQSNLIYYNYEIDGRNDYAASNIMLDNVMEPINDPRLSAFFVERESDGTWVGEVYGLSEANAAATPNSSVSQRSALIVSATLPGIYMDYAQVEFMLAEAIERGWTVPGGGTAEDHYKAGIQASIDYWTDLNGSPVSQGTIDAYIAQDSVDYNIVKASSSLGWKYAIGKQKWIALINQGIQGWTEWRRLDFGILQMPADGVLDGTGIPLRIKYAQDEITLNSANYAAAIAAQGPDLQDTKLWWDVN